MATVATHAYATSYKTVAVYPPAASITVKETCVLGHLAGASEVMEPIDDPSSSLTPLFTFRRKGHVTCRHRSLPADDFRRAPRCLGCVSSLAILLKTLPESALVIGRLAPLLPACLSGSSWHMLH